MLGIYIHIPFCIRKCHYCDFMSVTDLSLKPAYIAALKTEIELMGRMHRRAVDSVFFGGGTPSILDGAEVMELLDAVRQNFEVHKSSEITMEANPGTLSQENLYAYRKAGINRLSIGLQAAQNTLLEKIGRIHTREDFEKSFDMARAAGFENIGVDMIYALPGQTGDDVRETVEFILSKKPEHISAYALIIEEGTPLYGMTQNGEMELCDEDAELSMIHFVRRALEGKGYGNYEISNFALPGFECRHNLKYWNLIDYLGLGAAAHSCIGNMRFSNTKNIGEYIENMQKGGLGNAKYSKLNMNSARMEFIMLKLRLKEGFYLYQYKNKFKEDFLAVYADEIEQAKKWGLLAVREGRVYPTEKGFDLNNRLVLTLVENI